MINIWEIPKCRNSYLSIENYESHLVDMARDKGRLEWTSGNFEGAVTSVSCNGSTMTI